MNDLKLVDIAKAHIKKYDSTHLSCILQELIDEEMMEMEILNEELQIAEFDQKVDSLETQKFKTKIMNNE